MKLPEINWDEIQAIIDRAEYLHGHGLMDRATWLELNRQFIEASHARLEMPGIFSASGKTEWFEALVNGASERVA